MKRDRFWFPILGLALTVLSSYLCAAAYVVVTFLSLPSNDEAYRQPLALIDPFVMTVAIPIATVIAIVIFPIALLSLWRRNALRCTVLVLGVSLLSILCLTPYFSIFTIPISVLIAVVALLFCRFTNLPVFRLRQDSTKGM